MNDFPGSAAGAWNTAAVSQTPVPSQGSATPAGIRHAAGEFESILLNQWLEAAQNSFGSVPGAENDQDAGDQQMKSFAVQALSKGLTASGGIGLANLVSKALVAQHANVSGRGKA